MRGNKIALRSGAAAVGPGRDEAGEARLRRQWQPNEQLHSVVAAQKRQRDETRPHLSSATISACRIVDGGYKGALCLSSRALRILLRQA